LKTHTFSLHTLKDKTKRDKNNREVNVEDMKTCTLNTKKRILSKAIPESIVSKHGKEKLIEGKYRKRERRRVME